MVLYDLKQKPQIKGFLKQKKYVAYQVKLSIFDIEFILDKYRVLKEKHDTINIFLKLHNLIGTKKKIFYEKGLKWH